MAINIQSQTVNPNSGVEVAQSKPVNNVAASKSQQIEARQVEMVKPVETKSSQPVELSRESIEAAVSKLQDYVESYKRNLRFSVDNDTGRTVVRLLDSENKLLKQIPSEDLLELVKSLEHNKGLFFGEA